MAKKAINRKPISGKTKGLICLALLCALTVFLSVLGLNGMKLDGEGVKVLLPWVPVKGSEWPQALPMNRALDGGTYEEYALTLGEGETAEHVLQVINSRLSGVGEADRAVTLNGDAVRVEMRRMDTERLQTVRNLTAMKGRFEFRSTDGATVLTDKDIKTAVMSLNERQTAYLLTITINDEGAEKLQAAGAAYLTVYLDGEQVTSASASGNQLVMSFMTSNYGTATNMAFYLNTGSFDATLTRKDSGEVAASAASAKQVVFYAGVALLLAACLYLILTGKLTGLAGIWTVWCAVLLGFFFTATLVVPSVLCLNVGCLVAALLGILLAVYTAVTRKDAIGKNIADGQTPKQASKLGFRASAKQVWIVHGAAIAVALILMIFSFSKSTGYTLAAFVTASAITVVLMRAFQACFTAMSNKAGLFGKTK